MGTDAGDEDDVDMEELLDGAWSAVRRPLRTSAAAPWPHVTTVIGASVLAFCSDPTHGRIYFWLGRERKVLAWSAGSSRWSDFGGGRARGDADAAATAAREFVQETAGCVRYFASDAPTLRTTWEDIAASLRRGEYVLKLETALSDAAPLRLFVTFVVQVPWDPRAIMRFAHCRALLSGLHKRLLRLPLEAHESDALEPPDATQRAARERWVLYHPAVRKRTRPVPRAMLGGGSSSGMERVPVVDSVNTDYLEKDVLELWSVPQLRRGLQYDGILSNRDGSVESLRPCFITVLSEVFDELATLAPYHFSDTPAFASVSF